MSAKNIVRQLLDGSKKIDLMRKEIEFVFAMVEAYLAIPKVMARCFSFELTKLEFRGPGCLWVVTADIDNRGALVGLGIRYFVVREVGNTPFYLCGNSRLDRCRAAHVNMVHSQLSVLVEGMFEKFPELTTDAWWGPLLDAGAE